MKHFKRLNEKKVVQGSQKFFEGPHFSYPFSSQIGFTKLFFKGRGFSRSSFTFPTVFHQFINMAGNRSKSFKMFAIATDELDGQSCGKMTDNINCYIFFYMKVESDFVSFETRS